MHCFMSPRDKERNSFPLCHSPFWEREKQGGLYCHENTQKEKQRPSRESSDDECWTHTSVYLTPRAHTAEQLITESHWFFYPLTTKQRHHLNRKVLDPCSAICGFYVRRHFNGARRVTERNLHGFQHLRWLKGIVYQSCHSGTLFKH